MPHSFKKGVFNLHLLTIATLFLLLVTLTLSRKYIALAINYAAYNMGFNTNNIASANYVSFINEQSNEQQNLTDITFLNKKVNINNSLAQAGDVLGTQTSGERWIEVDLSEQRLYLKEGDSTANTFAVSTGKWYPTPTGEWRIWTKLRYTRMKGGSKALGTYYNLPNVPYTMYYNKGYGIHGAYWHSNFGQPMSHGCVNMKPEEAGTVFNWVSVGTRVAIHQ